MNPKAVSHQVNVSFDSLVRFMVGRELNNRLLCWPGHIKEWNYTLDITIFRHTFSENYKPLLYTQSSHIRTLLIWVKIGID